MSSTESSEEGSATTTGAKEDTIKAKSSSSDAIAGTRSSSGSTLTESDESLGDEETSNEIQVLKDSDFASMFDTRELGYEDDAFIYGAAPPSKEIIEGEDSLVGLYGDEISGTMEIPHVRCDNCNRTLIKLSTIYIDRLQKVQARYEKEGRSMTHKEFAREQGIILDEIAPTKSIIAIEKKISSHLEDRDKSTLNASSDLTSGSDLYYGDLIDSMAVKQPRKEHRTVNICCRKNIQEQIFIRRDIGPDTNRFIAGYVKGKNGHRRVGNVAVIRSDLNKHFDDLPLYNHYTYRSSKSSKAAIEDNYSKKATKKVTKIGSRTDKNKAASRGTDAQRKTVFDPTDIDPTLFPVMPPTDNDFVKESLPKPKDYLPNRRLIGVMLPGENIEIPMTTKGIKL